MCWGSLSSLSHLYLWANLENCPQPTLKNLIKVDDGDKQHLIDTQVSFARTCRYLQIGMKEKISRNRKAIYEEESTNNIQYQACLRGKQGLSPVPALLTVQCGRVLHSRGRRLRDEGRSPVEWQLWSMPGSGDPCPTKHSGPSVLQSSSLPTRRRGQATKIFWDLQDRIPPDSSTRKGWGQKINQKVGNEQGMMSLGWKKQGSILHRDTRTGRLTQRLWGERSAEQRRDARAVPVWVRSSSLQNLCDLWPTAAF